MKNFRILKQCIILSIIFFSIIFSINVASATDKTYYWTPSTGAIDSSGFTANWGNCNAQPTSYRITTLSSTGFACNSDRLTTASSGDQFLAIYPTAYSSDTQIKGKIGATFYLSSQRSGYTATYRFDLGYALGGTFTSIGYVTRGVTSSSGQSYTIDLSSIIGTAPAGSYPALKVSVTTSRGGRVYLGTNGGTTGSNSGRFYVNETESGPTPTPTPTPIPTITPTPTATPTPTPVDKTYYWDRTTGTSVAGYTTNWSTCSSSSPQSGFRTTSMGSAASTCANGQLSRTNAGDLFLTIYPTAYSSDIQIKGMANARFYLRSNSGSATYRFDLGYARSGTFTSLGNVTRTGVSTTGTTYTIDLSTISGTAPAGSNIALKVSVTTSGGGRVYMGTNGGSTGSNSGRFYVNETIGTIPTPTPTPTPTVTPTSAPKIIVKTNRYVVLDDPNTGTADTGFQNPNSNWGSNYWSGESTTIRAAAIVMSSNGTKLPGVTVAFNLMNPAGGGPVNTSILTTDSEGAAYYSYDLNAKNYWGNWKIDASTTTEGSNIVNSSSFILNWWGCANCHGSESIGSFGTYAPKSYYMKGIDIHRNPVDGAHSNAMTGNNCIECHMSYSGAPTFSSSDPNKQYSPDWHRGKATCVDCHKNANVPGNRAEIAGCYDTLGCHPKKNTNVNSENSTSGYVVGGNYKSLYSNIPNSAKAHTTTSVRCILCHDASHDISKPYNVSSTSNNITEDEQCWACHSQRNGTHFGTSCTSCHSQNAHSTSVSGGGPDCISCHGLGGTATHKIDQNAMAASVHSNLNSGTTANGVDAANKKCWGCHQSDGNQPTGMGDKYNTPYRCYECHGPTKPYTRVNGAMTINEHFKGAPDVKAGIFAIDDSASCALCHSVPEMRVAFTDNATTDISIGSHYGKNRIGNTLDCQYCHQNTSTTFGVAMMSNVENNNLSDHSRSPVTPVCTTCHGAGMLHNATLTKPASSNDTYCKTCHSNKNEHKTLYCTECHANNTDGSIAGREIHDIKYLQNGNTFSLGKANAIDCTACHQYGSYIINGTIGMTPSKISDPLHHSDDINNGSKWGNYWNNSLGSCIYCHNDTRHNVTPLGRPLTWNPLYILNTTIGTGNNCANCHYKGDNNYINMQNTYTSAGLEIPPEITNGSWNDKSGYYNHTLSNYTDYQCKSCHDTAGSTTVGQMMHNVSVGISGGADCKTCHDVGGSAPKLVNFSAANNSAHKNLNSGASSTVDIENKKCWACHGDGTQPVSGHPANYKTPSLCENCHTGLGGFNAPLVNEHIQNGTDVKTAANCSLCHDNNGMYLNGAGIGTVTHYLKDITDKATTPYGHFGPIDTSNCLICHNGIYTGDPIWGSPINITTSFKRVHTETSNTQCDTCHKDGTIQTLANVDFHNSSLTGGVQGPNCLTCHANAE